MGAIASSNLCPISQVRFALPEEIMSKAYEVMTRALATCAPDASVAHVAAIMRDRDIGDVLIVEDGRLRGIVTDRDLALQALTGKDDPLQTPIRKFMSTQVVTGEAAWSLEQVAKIMAQHQVRRLPIVQGGQLVGIVSLGDVALHEDRKGVAAKSLRAISTPIGISASGQPGRGGALIGLALAALATTMIAWLTWSHSGQALRKQMVQSKLYLTGQHAAGAARDKVDQAASSELVRDLRRQMRTNLNDLSAHLPTLEYKPPKRKHS
jgi:CBS domain-containing protein